MTNVAVTWAWLTTATLLAVMSVPEKLNVAPARFVPARIMLTLVPAAPAAGVMLVAVGAAALIVKVTAPLVPAAVVMVIFCGPVAALAPMAKVAVTCVALTTARFETVMPEPALSEEAPARLLPDRLTLTEAPCAPAFGPMPVSVGGGAAVMLKL